MKYFLDTIHLDDKFKFIEYLFQNNFDEFGDVCRQISNCNTRDEALKIFTGLRTKYDWYKEQARAIVAQDFLGCIKSYFSQTSN